MAATVTIFLDDGTDTKIVLSQGMARCTKGKSAILVPYAIVKLFYCWIVFQKMFHGLIQIPHIMKAYGVLKTKDCLGVYKILDLSTTVHSLL